MHYARRINDRQLKFLRNEIGAETLMQQPPAIRGVYLRQLGVTTSFVKWLGEILPPEQFEHFKNLEPQYF